MTDPVKNDDSARGVFSIDPLLQRDRAVLVLAIAFTTALAWGYMVREARGMRSSGVCHCMGMAMASPETTQWSAIQWMALFFMWAEMMVAMMLPSAAPMILLFASVNRRRREQERPFVSTSLFVAGYLIVWCGFSAVATFAQWGLHQAAWLSPAMVATNRWVGAALLLFAGLFQFTPWKTACLIQCANPLGFLLTEWREGWAGAVRMGVRHGVFCLGCCWLLMLLLFVFGVMNILWIALLTVYVLAEKLMGRVAWVQPLTGGLLCAAAIWMMFS